MLRPVTITERTECMAFTSLNLDHVKFSDNTSEIITPTGPTLEERLGEFYELLYGIPPNEEDSVWQVLLNVVDSCRMCDAEREQMRKLNESKKLTNYISIS